MQAFTRQRDRHAPDTVWMLEHTPVFTQGRAGRSEHLLDAGDIPVVQSDRGGQVTYHGPGQLMVYTLFDLKRLGIGVKAFVHWLEQQVIDYLNTDDISAVRRSGAPGVYVGGAKVAALGLRVSRGCSYHGFALNVAMDLSPYARINPCGYQGMAVTDLATLGLAHDMSAVRARLAAQLQHAYPHLDGGNA